MTTTSNAIKTNSIDTVTAGTLTIGGTNTTQVNINENVTVSGTLGATTVTATGGITTPVPILLSYISVPTFTSNQIGYQEVRTLTTTSASLTSNTLTPVPFSSNIILPVGVWNISFGVRFISTGTTLVTAYETYATFASNINIGGVNVARNLGLTSYTTTTGSSYSVTSTDNLAVNDSINISNNVGNNNLSLQVKVVFTGDPIAVLGETTIPPETVATPNTYLIATRIG
jgi:hypothetical protein